MSRPVARRVSYTKEIESLLRIRRVLEADERPQWRDDALTRIDELVRKLTEKPGDVATAAAR